MQVHPEPDSVDAFFGSGVNALRVRRDLSQRALARQLTEAGMAVDASAISRIENGTRSVRLPEAVLIASVLGVHLESLLMGVDMPSAIESAQSHVEDAERLIRSAVSLYVSSEVGLAAAADDSGQSPTALQEVEELLNTTPVDVAREQLHLELEALDALDDQSEGRFARLLGWVWHRATESEEERAARASFPVGYHRVHGNDAFEVWAPGEEDERGEHREAP